MFRIQEMQKRKTFQLCSEKTFFQIVFWSVLGYFVKYIHSYSQKNSVIQVFKFS